VSEGAQFSNLPQAQQNFIIALIVITSLQKTFLLHTNQIQAVMILTKKKETIRRWHDKFEDSEGYGLQVLRLHMLLVYHHINSESQVTVVNRLLSPHINISNGR
jgi:hypothetical protein